MPYQGYEAAKKAGLYSHDFHESGTTCSLLRRQLAPGSQTIGVFQPSVSKFR